LRRWILGAASNLKVVEKILTAEPEATVERIITKHHFIEIDIEL
jgi:hypothetical protein